MLMLPGISGLPDTGVCLFQKLGVITVHHHHEPNKRLTVLRVPRWFTSLSNSAWSKLPVVLVLVLVVAVVVSILLSVPPACTARTLMPVSAMRIESCQRNVSSAPADFSGFKMSLKVSLKNASIFDSFIYLIYFNSVL